MLTNINVLCYRMNGFSALLSKRKLSMFSAPIHRFHSFSLNSPRHPVLPRRKSVALMSTVRRWESTKKFKIEPNNQLEYDTQRLQESVQSIEAKVEDRIPVFIVDDIKTAQHALQVLMAHPNHVWACDTEVADIDVKTQGPVGNGRVICASIYGGEDVDFGDGKKTLWIKNDGTSEGVLDLFKDWFESDLYHKVWHNYGFDRHVMYNEGIDCRGFAGDTMHMARLWDSSREKGTGGGDGYSLEALSSDAFLFRDDIGRQFAKTKMKDLFGVAKVKKDGGESKVKDLPDLRHLQNDPTTKDLWIEYSARDAVATWWVREKLMRELKNMPWKVAGVQLPRVGKEAPNMFHFYMRYLKDFGECLTDMERNGIKLDTTGHLKQAEAAARAERFRMETMFLDWAKDYCSEVKYINIASSTQMQQLLFGEYEDYELKSSERVFRLEKSVEEIAAEREAVLAANPYAEHSPTQLKELLKERGLKVTGKRDDLITRLVEYNARLAELLQEKTTAELEELCVNRGLDAPENYSETSAQEAWAHVYLKSEMLDGAKEQRKLSREAKKRSKQEEAEAAAAGIDTSALHSTATTATTTTILSTPSNATLPKKYKDITITTIGLKPKDFTPGGSAQVSAAVLKKLSGKNVFGDGKYLHYICNFIILYWLCI